MGEELRHGRGRLLKLLIVCHLPVNGGTVVLWLESCRLIAINRSRGRLFHITTLGQTTYTLQLELSYMDCHGRRYFAIFKMTINFKGLFTKNSASADKPRDAFRGQSIRSPNMMPFHVFLCFSIIVLFVILSIPKRQIFEFKECGDFGI